MTRKPFLSILVALALALGAPWPAAAQSSSSSTSQGTGAPTGGQFAPGRLVVKFRSTVTASDAVGALAQEGLQASKRVGISGASLVQVQPGHELETAQQLGQLSGVEYALPDYVVRKSAQQIPADPLYESAQWDMARINMPAAWGVTTGAASMRVAVIDSGIMANHPDLATQWEYAPVHTAADHVFLTPPLSTGCTAPTSPTDEDGHGTHVSGTIAAASTLVGAPATGIAGIAPSLKLLPLKALDCAGAGYLSDVAAAIEFAALNGASVINMSLGGAVATGCPLYLQSSINLALAAGVFMVAAAGNDGDGTIQYPAGCTGVVGVGSTDSSDLLSPTSNRNASVALSAPGVLITSSWNDGGYRALSGTSMATPHVSACAALVKSMNASLTGAAIRTVLQSTAVDLGAPGVDSSFGYGRLDCGAAVAQAGSQTPPIFGNIGGRGLTITTNRSGVGLSWQGGTGQTGYNVSRMVDGVITTITPNPLSAAATTFADGVPATGMNCYAVFPLGTNPPAQSDAECIVVGFHSAAAAPQTFSLRMNQTSTAILAWSPPAGQFDGYLVQTFGGSSQSLPVTTTAITAPMTGLTCFAVGTTLGGVLQGYTDILCGVPGFTNLSSSGQRS